VYGAVSLHSLGYSSGDVVLMTVVGLFFALMGYHISVRHRLLHGVTPWRLPSIFWAVLCGIFPPGIIVEIVAEVTTRPQPRPSPTPGVTGRPADPFAFGGQRAAGSDMLAPIEIAPGPTALHPSFIRPPDDGSGKPALFGWYPDVTGRHELRYWDGRGWTANVADRGTRATDPV
jgi:hypothetical protein